MNKNQLLDIIKNAKDAVDYNSAIETILKKIQEYTNFECVAIRIKNDIGDYPYFSYIGFKKEFIEEENSLCQIDRYGNITTDNKGNPVLECMCGNIICGRFNSDLPFFTQNGSFWTNSTTELLSHSTEEDRQARTRNRCHGEGYESVGLFPLKIGTYILGLIQLNDSKKNMFSDILIKDMELIATCLGDLVYYVLSTKDSRNTQKSS
jgi:hypothetical protein